MNRLKEKIVIFEPDEGLRESLKLILEDDYILLLADSLKAVLDYVALQKVDLFIMDVNKIPDSLGIVKEVKRENPELTILLLSVNFELSFQEKAIRIGTGVRFQEKPFESRDFLERVQTLIRGYSLKRHRFILKIDRNQ